MSTTIPTRHFPRRGEVVEEWWCPVCVGPAHRTHRPGRPRIYCTNACRQRAYRWRRENHARLAATPEHPAERASVGLKGHALRSTRDFVSRCSDQRRREVTVCGTLARPARYGRYTHTNFMADKSSWSCVSCIRLIAIPNDELTSDPAWPPLPPPRRPKWRKRRKPPAEPRGPTDRSTDSTR